MWGYCWGGMRILVVEDEPKVAGALETGLGAEGYDVAVALTGVWNRPPEFPSHSRMASERAVERIDRPLITVVWQE